MLGVLFGVDSKIFASKIKNTMGRRKKRKPLISHVTITGIADKGRGVGRDEEGRVLFVDEVVPGDIVNVQTTRKKKGTWFGRPDSFVKLSAERATPFCKHFDYCGGCKWQHLSYEGQVKYKQQMVKDVMQRIGKVQIGTFLPLDAAAKSKYYRNKLEFTFSNKRWLTPEELSDETISNEDDVLGFHRAGAFDKVIDIEHCWLGDGPSNEIRNFIKKLAIEQGLSFFDIRENKGFLRQVMIRITSIGEILLVVVFFEKKERKISKFLSAVSEAFPKITSLYYCINPKVNDFIMDLDMVLFQGKPQIEEQLGHVRFKIGAKSFFQTNTYQAVYLYNQIVEFAQFDGTENVYDLYTGIGSIALYVADKVKQVVGIEEIEDAIHDADENAALNGIGNCIFYAGDVKNILTDAFAQKHGRPDIVITDPPRAGMHPDVVAMLLKLAVPKIIYVSCNPATQARDLQLLSEKYRVIKLRPVDMFPHTHHVESIALLELG